jgi:hypothetical protein
MCATKEHIETAEVPLTCFQCLGEYSNKYGVARHFKTLHLKDRKCNFCDPVVEHEMHLRRHAEQVHRLQVPECRFIPPIADYFFL